MGMDIYHNEFIGFCFHSRSRFSEMSKEIQQYIKDNASPPCTDSARPMARDLYGTLGVPRTSEGDTIRKAFYKLAAKYYSDYSDKNPGKDAEAEFKEINQAHEVLSDTGKRALYDEFGDDSLRSGFDADRARRVEFDSFCDLISELSEELDLDFIQRVESPDFISEIAIGVNFFPKKPSRQGLSEAKSKIKDKLPEINNRLGTDFKMKDLVRDCWIEISV